MGSMIPNVYTKINRPQKRLTTQKPDGGRASQQVRDSLVGGLLVLDTRAEPDVREGRVELQEFLRVQPVSEWGAVHRCAELHKLVQCFR